MRRRDLLEMLVLALLLSLAGLTGCSDGSGVSDTEDAVEEQSEGGVDDEGEGGTGGDDGAEDESGDEGESEEESSGEGGSSEGDGGDAGEELASPEPLFCDHPLYDDVEWIEVDMGELVFEYLAGSPAERDIDRIVADRQRVYDDIVDFLGLEHRPTVTVVLSPNRMAAAHHGYAVGRAFKSRNTVEVLWPEGEGSYERERPGHELAHVLGAHVDGNAGRLAFLDEGLAEYLDGSGRDLHREYVDKLLSGHEAGFLTRLDDYDAWGMNYGRAGSFVAFLIERYGSERFLDLWMMAATTGGWSQVTTLGDSVQCGQSLEHALDRMLRESHGIGFDAARLAWEAALQPQLEVEPGRVAEEDLEEMLWLLAVADDSVARGDALGYRATLEGFYCDGWTDDEKAEISREVVSSYESLETVVVSAFPVGIRNYEEVLLHTVRREERSEGGESLRTGMVWMEHFPEGWRISWSTAW